MKLERRILFVLVIATLLVQIYVLWPTPRWAGPMPGFKATLQREINSDTNRVGLRKGDFPHNK